MAVRGATSGLPAVQAIIADMTRPGTSRSFNNLHVTREMVSRLGLSKELAQLSFVHVAGTKGKGSTCFATAQLLQAAGLRVGLFTSPHLVDVRERCTVNGQLLDEARFSQYFTEFQREHDEAFDAKPWEHEVKADGTPGSLPQKSAFFRFMFLLSLRVFAQERVDVVVLEVGVGGRIDSTNVVQPRVCGITALGFDHMDILGDTMAAIAGEKAGIMKPGVPCFSSPQHDHPETLEVLVRRAAEVDAPLHVLDEAWHAQADWSAIRTRGAHMVENSKLALALARTYLGKSLDAAVTADEIAVLTAAAYPGRSMVFPVSVKGVKFYLDGAHTPESMRVAAEWFMDASELQQKRQPSSNGGGDASVDDVAACSRDTSILFFTSRDAALLLKELMPYAQRIRRISFVRFAHSSSQLPAITVERLEATKAAWQQLTRDCVDESAKTAAERVELVVREAPLATADDLADAARGSGGSSTHPVAPEVPALVTGSLYLIGTALEILRREAPQP